MKGKAWRSCAIGVLTGFCNGLFGAGGGMVAVFALERYLDMEPERAHATALSIMLPLTAVSLSVFLLQNALEWQAALYVAPALAAGSFLGAKLLAKIHAVWLNRIFSVLMLAAGMRMLF